MGLSHFNNVLSHNQNNEPIYKALFEITFDLPPAIGASTEETVLLLESARNITLPLTPAIEVQVQRFKFSTRAYVTLPTETHVSDLSINFNLNEDDKNSVFVWKLLKKWYDLAWNSQTGETHTKREMIGRLIVNVHNKKGKVIRRVEYINVQITTINEWELNWDTSTEIMECTANFIADYWYDLYI